MIPAGIEGIYATVRAYLKRPFLSYATNSCYDNLRGGAPQFLLVNHLWSESEDCTFIQVQFCAIDFVVSSGEKGVELMRTKSEFFTMSLPRMRRNRVAPSWVHTGKESMLGSTGSNEPSNTGVRRTMRTTGKVTVDLAARRERLTCQLQARRNAVCEEIEKGIRIDGTSLFKLRKNFSVTHRLPEWD